jgi:hypothetical protein
MNQKYLAILVVCIALVAAAGCSALPGGSFAKTQSSQEVVHVAEADYGYGGSWESSSDTVYTGMAVPAATVVPTAAPTPGSAGTGSEDIGTKIIKTGDVTIEVNDVTGAMDSLKTLAAAQGGYLSSTNVRKGSDNRLTGSATLRVPQAAFENAIAGVKGLGTVKSISTSGQDVTEEYVDIVAQKTSYTNQLAQYNAIMKQSTEVEDIIKVQEQIDRVQTQLDRLNGRLNYLNNRIDLSTISVYLQEPEPVGGQAGHDFVATINEGIAGFFGMIDALIVLLFTLLPLIILGLIGYGVYRWHRKTHPAPKAAAEDKKE